MPLWDPELAAEEVRRLAAKGVHSVTFTENPATLGYPSFHSASGTRCGRPAPTRAPCVSIHLGSSGQLAVTAPTRPST